MGLIQAAAGAIGGTLADQWKDFYSVSPDLRPTVAISAAEKQGTNSGRGSNTSASESIITNGSKFIVPEGYGLVLVQDGAFTGFVTEPGAYTWSTEDLDSKSVFAGNGFWTPLIKNSWEKFKLGGRAQSEQQAFFVSLQELGNNKFASASEIYWDDKFLNTQAGAVVRGVFSIKLSDPLLFLKTFVPPVYLKNGRNFDFTDLDNPSAQQLFNEVVGSLSAAFSQYANDSNKGNRISEIQKDSVGFASALSNIIEEDYSWGKSRGLTIVSTSIVSIQYDDATKAVLETVQRADALSGQRGNSNLQASIAAGIEAAGSTEGAAGILGLGIAAGSIGLGSVQQPNSAAASNQGAEGDSFAKLANLKKMLDEGLITQVDYEAAKTKLLGL
jgi:membrane protease subunit (stomatin/prohibitin family)